MKAFKNSMMVVAAAMAMTSLTACDGGGGWTGSVSVVVDSDTNWGSDSWNGWDESRSGNDRRARERVGPGTGDSSGCDMLRDSSGRIRSTCPGGRLSSSFIPVAAVNRTALKYSIPLESAERLHAALSNAKLSHVTFLSSIGISESDAIKIAVGGLISDSTLDRIGEELALSRTMTRELITTIIAETKAQMADTASPVWKACMATGKWKTNANGGTCKSLSWQGCAPATGASFCASVY